MAIKVAFTDKSFLRELLATPTGNVLAVVSNAGNAPSGQLQTDTGEALLRQSLELNFMSHQLVAHAAVDVMLAQGTGGCLLFNASKSAFNPGRDFGPYAVPKAAVIALMRQYAVDLGSHRIRANAVNADRIRTALFDGLVEARAKARGVEIGFWSYFKVGAPLTLITILVGLAFL